MSYPPKHPWRDMSLSGYHSSLVESSHAGAWITQSQRQYQTPTFEQITHKTYIFKIYIYS